MIVPQYWAEGRARGSVDGRRCTIRRFGWSDKSLEDAQSMADARAREAFDRLSSGDKVAPREPKISYNGAAGVPIREEIIDRHGDTVITRNIYGARCLNTPKVLFVDVDFEEDVTYRSILGTAVVLLAVAAFVGWFMGSWVDFLLGALLALYGAYAVAARLNRLRLRSKGGAEGVARGRIDAFMSQHPDWHLRLYRTPAGFRALAMHRTFDPGEAEAAECFEALKADRVYVLMCLNQQCFRARVSPKPWRVGIDQHIRPRPGVWPVNPERMPERSRWIEAYERAARDYASCRFVETLGAGPVDPTALAIQVLHDDLCRATTTLPLA